MQHPSSPPPVSVFPVAGGKQRYPPALHVGVVFGANDRPKCNLPRSSCLAPSTRPLLPDDPLVTHWLHTPADRRGVRAGCSARARTRTGRIRRHCFPPFTSHRFLDSAANRWRLTQRVRQRPRRASASPLSRWGQFPIFTGVKVIHRAAPKGVAP